MVVGSINISQSEDSPVPVEDSSSHQASYAQNVGQYDAQHCNWPSAPVAAVSPLDARPRAQQHGNQRTNPYTES